MAAFSPTGRMLVARGLYRHWLNKYFSTITLAGLAPDDEPILLRQIYVPLILTPERVSDYAPEEEIQRDGRMLPLWLQQILGEAVLFISGEAGSGKSTLISSIVDSLAGEAQDDLNLQFGGYVPFPIRLREAPLEKIDSLDSLIAWWLGEVKGESPKLEPEDLKSFLEHGRGIILLDGLDELGTIHRRARLLEWLREHRWVPGGEAQTSNLVIVTARPSGFEGILERRLPKVLAHVAPFSRQQIRSYLSRWFELRSLRTGQRLETVDTLLIRLTARQQAQRLLPLARRPAYLASLAFVHGTRGELPYSRAALYELLVDAYIEMLDRQRGLLDRAENTLGLPIWDRQEKIEVLSAVAFQAHVGSTTSKDRFADRRILWSRKELEAAVRMAIEDGEDRFRTVRPEHAALLTDYFVARTGLLVETREGLFQFGHLSFQEYLTALFLLSRATAGSDKAEELERILFPRLNLPGWLEVGVLVLAIDAVRSAGKGHAPVLARLNLYNIAQLSLLAQILSGEELRFTKAERHSWLFVFLGFMATAKSPLGPLEHYVLQFPANQSALAIAWLEICRSIARNESPIAALNTLILKASAEAERSTGNSRSPLDLLLSAAPAEQGEIPSERSAACRAWRLIREPKGSYDAPNSFLLGIPLQVRLPVANIDEALLGVIEGAEMARREQHPDRILRPTRVWSRLDEWSLHLQDRIWLPLAGRTPVLFWLTENFFGLRQFASLADSRGLDPRIVLRFELQNIALLAELCWRVSLILQIATGVLSELTAQANDLLIVDQELAYARDLNIHPSRLADQLTLLARALTRSSERRSRDQARARVLAHLVGNDLATRLTDFLKRTKAGSPYRPILSLLLAGGAGLTICPFLRGTEELDRTSVSDLLLSLDDPACFALMPDNAEDQNSAFKEWKDVLDSPLSPIRLLKNSLTFDWARVPTDPDEITQALAEALQVLESVSAQKRR